MAKKETAKKGHKKRACRTKNGRGTTQLPVSVVSVEDWMSSIEKRRAEKPTGGGGADLSDMLFTDIDTEAQNFSQSKEALKINHAAELAMKDSELAMKDSEIQRLQTKLLELRKRLNSFPNDLYEMADLIRKAPTPWHLELMVEMILRSLRSKASSRRSPDKVENAHKALAQITMRFHCKPKKPTKKNRPASIPTWLKEAFQHPAFLAVWNTPLPRKTRGGTDGNGSMQIVSRFVELSMLGYDEEIAWRNQHLPNGGPSQREIYEQQDNYINGYLEYAEASWNKGGWKWCQSLQKDFGHKLRTNDSNKVVAENGKLSAKQSFGLFKPDIKKEVRFWLEYYRGAWPPNGQFARF
jgi:hypothetical protein